MMHTPRAMLPPPGAEPPSSASIELLLPLLAARLLIPVRLATSAASAVQRRVWPAAVRTPTHARERGSTRSARTGCRST